MGLHFFTGFVILNTRYAHLSHEGRANATRLWSLKLLKVLGIELRVSGSRPDTFQHNTLLVSNHISWMDIIALASCTPTRFIAKKEIRHWPIIGRMAHVGGTLFIDRSNRRDASRVNRHMAEALQNGDCLAVFPEGTTSTGQTLLPFKSSLFESAVLANSIVQPVTIRYLDDQGEHTAAPSYAGETTFWQSLSRLLQLRHMTVELYYGNKLIAGSEPLLTRFELAEAARHEIATGLKQLPGTPDIPEQIAVCPPSEVQ
jgi:1-acyl-sn-glycerol-3-phosphate acyltransferase